MKLFTKKDKEPDLIEELIKDNLQLMSGEFSDLTGDGYQMMLKNVERLKKLEIDEKRSRSVSPDTIAVIAGNLLGIGLILGYEHAHVICSKALGFVIRGRV